MPQDPAGTTTPPLPARVRAFGAATAAGEALLLQICFVLASLPLVTVLPAAVALQRSLREVFVGHDRASAVRFGGHFVTALRQTWKIAVVQPAFALAAIVSAAFWASAGGVLSAVALSLLAAACGAATAAYLAFIAAAAILPPTARPRRCAFAAWALARRRPLRFAGAVVLSATWALLLARVPTLLLVGSGLVPAALAWWAAAPWLRASR
ncbi:hypothetical protein [Sinomonas sp. G460-2]|uniref:hypothetical protein n=1 Tax=Sinomonas sp. G460-2 TaxID=3393464 RepID=UPI0039F09535